MTASSLSPPASRAPRRLPSRRWWLALAAIVVVLGGYAAAAAIIAPGEHRRALLNPLEPLTALLTALVLIVVAGRCWGVSRRLAWAWAILAAAHLAYAGGDALWVIGGVTTAHHPLSSLMNGLYLAFYPLFLVALLRLPRAPLSRRRQLKLLLDLVIVTLAAALVLWLGVLRPYLVGPDHDLGRVLVSSAYPVGDLIILWAVLTLLLNRRQADSLGVYGLLATGAGLLIVADLVNSFVVMNGAESLGVWAGLGFAASHLVVVLAALRQVEVLSVPAEGSDGTPLERPETTALYLAFAALGIAWLVVISGTLEDVTVVGAVLILAMVAAVLGREIVGVGENVRLWARLADARDRLEDRVTERTGELAAEIAERTAAEERLRRRVAELTAVNAVAQLAVEADDEASLIARATAAIRDSLYPDNCGVLLVAEGAGVLYHTETYHSRSPEHTPVTIPVGHGVTGWVAATGQPRRVADATADPDYLSVDPAMRSELCVPMKVGSRVIGVIDAESSTPEAFSDEDEQVLTTLASQLATAIDRLRAAAAVRESERRFRRLSEAAFEGIALLENGMVLDANTRLAEMLACPMIELVGSELLDWLAPESRAPLAERLAEGVDLPLALEACRRGGERFPVEVQARPLPYHGRLLRVLAVRDVSERWQAERRIQLQLRRLAALRAIDTAISSSRELAATLDVFLEHAHAELDADAAALLLLDRDGRTLRVAAARGDAYPCAGREIDINECLAGRAARERKLVAFPNLRPGDPCVLCEGAAADIAFAAYFAAPLLLHGEVTGVLGIFLREPFHPDQEWLDFLTALAGQAAIAVDTMTLFADLQRTNQELAEAYDTTLEGWSRALELRDQETQGHTLRVTDLTVRLARAAGIAESELIHVRRGALLHDIGKMGIPDAILLKPGPLSEAEWRVMRRHPEYALQLLRAVPFLGQALFIPYCHHERWNGSGYPRGLRGEAIPLAARVFAVIDSWDALRSDRPYRAAWPDDEVVQYIRDQAGVAFDPHIVELFLRLLEEEE